MPRSAKPSANRSDLLMPTNRNYGARKDTEAALAAVPASGINAEGGGPSPSGGGDLASLLAAAQSQTPSRSPLAQPSQRPSEPVTTGLPIGPGAGPEAAALPPRGPNPDLALWAAWMPALDFLASSPGSSTELRQFYRRLRASMPQQQR